jgi:hypothetical protein
MASEIRGEWTHRRGDAGGTRAVAAEIDHPRPAVAWVWKPDHGGRIDQVRLVGSSVIVATMMPGDERAPGWEHAVIYMLDAVRGEELARRVLPDPVPVAAMVVAGEPIHIVATRTGEPIFWYTLTPDLLPIARRVVTLSSPVAHDDVLDAWATPGGLWLELEGPAQGVPGRARAYAYVDPDADATVARTGGGAPGDAPERDACSDGRDLFVPLNGLWASGPEPIPPALARLEPSAAGDGTPWVRAKVTGPRAQVHALCSGGLICAVSVAEDPLKPERARVEAFAVDSVSGEVRWRNEDERVDVKARLGDGARFARRDNGELLFQSLGPDGTPSTPLLCVRPDGKTDALLLGAKGPYVLDAALGDLVLGHREGKDGRVEVGGFAIDHQGRLLGRRAVPSWTIETESLGAGATVYAGAGAVVIRGERALAAITL